MILFVGKYVKNHHCIYVYSLVCQPLTANVTLFTYSGFTGGVAAKIRLRNCLTLSQTHTYMLRKQLKGTETMFPFSGAVISPDSRPLCPRAKWSVRFIKQIVPDAVPRCVFAAS